MDKINKKNFWNIVKGVGILSIVIGHCYSKLVYFVYLYHLAIFFFASGYFYNEDKYGDDPLKNFAARLKNNWSKYVIFSVFYTIMHNAFVNHGLIISHQYTLRDIITSIFNTGLFFGTESLGGALWFVPVLILASTLFGYIIYFSRKIDNKIKKGKYPVKDIIIILSTVLVGIIGIILNYKNVNLMYHIQTIFLVIPFFTAGYYLSNRIKNYDNYLKWYLFIPVLIGLCYFAFGRNYFIDLSINNIGNVYLFYFISFCGIYFCLYLSKVINAIPKVKNYFSILGKYSFEIMASHFLIFKIIDVIYAKVMGIRDINIIGNFPYAFDNLWPVYILLGASIPAFLAYYIKEKKHNQDNIIEKVLKNKKLLISLVVIIAALVCLPYLRLGIMHNDELMSRYWSSQGFVTFYNHYFIEQIQKGRALSSVIIPFTMFLGFIGQKSLSFKFLQIISIVICSFLFSKLINKIFKNKNLSILFFLLFMVFLPISFEPTVPNVFVTFYNVSVSALIYSFMLFYDYLEDNKKWKLIISMIIFFVVEVSYEAFVTYVPIYLLLVLYKKGFKEIFKNIRYLIAPILTGVIYLVLYIIFSKLFPSNYSGNQINGIDLINSLMIVYNLGKYTFPGSYILSSKYSFLFNYYYTLNINYLIRVVIISLLTILVLVKVLKKEPKNQVSNINLGKTVFASLALIVLPILPISVASMYQDAAIGTNILGLPVSFFSYFGSVLLVSIFIIYLNNKYEKTKIITIPIIVIMVFFVQLMNSTFAEQADKDFKRIETIESFLTSDIMKNYDGYNIYSTDIFEVKDALFVHDNYWNEFTNLRGLKANYINKEYVPNDENKNIELQFNDNIFIIIDNKKYYIFTKDQLNSDIVKTDRENIAIEDTKVYNEIEGWKVYPIKKEKEQFTQCKDIKYTNKISEMCNEKNKGDLKNEKKK